MTHFDHETLRCFLDEAAEDCTTDQIARSWRAWRATVPVALALTAGCGAEAQSDPPVGEGACSGDNCEAECSDGADNDSDGLTDCDDPQCEGLDSCARGSGGSAGAVVGTLYGIPYETDCDDQRDNDSDQLVDCADPDCDDVCASSGGTGGTGGYPASGGLYGIPYSGGSGGYVGGTGGYVMGTGGAYGIPYELCYDGADNDSDGLVDCEDPSCFTYPTCVPVGGAGGEGGGPVANPGGAGGTGGYVIGTGGAYGIPYELWCNNGTDDDFDGRADCADPDCYDDEACWAAGGQGGMYGIPWGGAAGSGAQVEICDDGVDNDDDELVDCLDDDCSLSMECAMVRYGIPY